MDIQGLNPTIITDQPVFPDNWKELSQKAKDCYNELDKEYHDENPGVYFRANVWSWRPIHMLCEAAVQRYELDINTEGWAYNSGDGLKTEEDCNKLADSLDTFIESVQDKGITTIGFAIGSWRVKNENGKGYTAEGLNKADTMILDNQFKNEIIDKVPIKYKTIDGKHVDVYPSYQADIEHLIEFISFLRECGGFKIY